MKLLSQQTFECISITKIVSKYTDDKGIFSNVVYHVTDDGCIQEFNTLKEDQDYVRYLNNLDELEGV